MLKSTDVGCRSIARPAHLLAPVTTTTRPRQLEAKSGLGWWHKHSTKVKERHASDEPDVQQLNSKEKGSLCASR